MPVRTCIICRKTAEKHSLLRFVFERGDGDKPQAVCPQRGKARLPGGDAGKKGLACEPEGKARKLMLDALHRLPGRGVYCHCRASCFGDRRLLQLADAALKRGSRRAAKSGGVQPGSVWDPLAMLREAPLPENRAGGGKAKKLLENIAALRCELEKTAKPAADRQQRFRIRF